MLAWWAFTDKNQSLPLLDTSFEIEHIFAKKRQENDKSLTNIRNLESLGNKSLLEKNINIRASDYRFIDKTKYYNGFTNDKGQNKEGTKIAELQKMPTTYTDFIEQDIENRNDNIINGFIVFLKDNELIK